MTNIRFASMPRWKKWRNRRASAQRNRCWYCRRRMKREGHMRRPTLDHYIPLGRGGADEFENTVAACEGCNNRKGDMLGDAFMLMNQNAGAAAPLIIGTAFAALITALVAKITKDERSDARAMKAAAALLKLGHQTASKPPIHPDQDATGDMPEKSPVQAEIEAVQERAMKFGGDQGLREDTRFRARFTEARPEPAKRDWM